MVDKRIIAENFSKQARYYDRYSAIQDFCASRLIGKTGGGDFKNILDIGCGTGNYTLLLRERFPFAGITAVDISAEMIEAAQEKLKNDRIEFIAADAENFKLGECFDLISSNASFQWFSNLASSLAGYKEALNKGGRILFSTFGPQTFSELRKSLEEFFKKRLCLSANSFPKKREVEKILRGLFSEVEVKEENHKESYSSLWDLLEGVRRTGARGSGLESEVIWTPRIIASIENIYKKKFGNITATYQIFFCRGIKK